MYYPQEMLSFVDSEDYQLGRPGGGKPQQHLSFVDFGKNVDLKDLKNTPNEVEILRKKFENETQDVVSQQENSNTGIF